MQESNIQLTFKCPVKWSSLPASADGRYCADCKKVVKDFAGAETKSIAAETIEAHACGSFKVTQLHQPFNDKRDVLINYYQRLNKNQPSRKVFFMLVTAVLFITGCHPHRRLSGAYAYKSKQSHKNTATEQVSVDHKKAGF